MKLEIRLYAGLKCDNRDLDCFGQKEFYLDVPEGITVKQLHDLLQLSSTLPLVTLVNGLSRSEELVLAGNDRVGIFPPVGGG